MKIAFLLAYAVLTTRRVACAAIQSPIDLISLDDITEADKKHLEYLNSYFYPERPKRSHHEDAINSLKASIGHGIKSKLGLLAKGSASASSHFSSGSSGGHGHSYHHHYHHDIHPEYDHKQFDFWSLKKSILNTLLQAVKAIKGGVIAIKGQLIKGSGYLISAKGKLISSKGEAITNLGKNIATSAILSPTHGHSDEHSHGHYHHSAPEEYGSPSAPGPEYELPEHHYHHHEDKPDADHAGILILKKIPKHESHEHSEPVEHKVPDFKPIGHSGPGLGEIIGKFFSASTSLKPGEPAPFGDEHHHYDHEHYHSDHDHHHSDHDHYHSDHDHHHSDHEHYHSDHDHHHDSSHPSHTEYHHESHPSSHGEEPHEYAPTHSDSSDHDKPSSNYGSPFEEAPAFLNLEEYASESKKQTQTVTQAPTDNPTPEAQKLQAPIKYDEIRPLPTAYSNVEAQNIQNPIKYDEIRPLPTAFSNAGFDTSFLLNTDTKPNLYIGTLSNKPNTAFPPYPQPTAFAVDTTSLQYGGFRNPTSGSDIKYLAPPSVGPQIFPTNLNPHHAYPQSIRYQGLRDTFESSSHKAPLKRPTRSKPYHGHHHRGHKRPILPSPEFMQALMYKMKHNGPKR